jgi:hypothetical protein
MKILYKIIFFVSFLVFSLQTSWATSYYIHPTLGNDDNLGTSKSNPFKTLAQIQKISLKPGDEVVLANGQIYLGSLSLINQQGNKLKPIKVTSIKWDIKDTVQPAIIDFKGLESGILIQDCSFIKIFNIKLTANGYENKDEIFDMRCGLLVVNTDKPKMTDIFIDHVFIKDVYYENSGFQRGKEEMHSANGTQKYGWGIRVISKKSSNVITNVQISDCDIKDVSHTGIKLSGSQKNINEVKILNNKVTYTGGPGIQMSEVKSVYVAKNTIDHSGSNNESRKWGRGSGLWTWGSSNVLIEKNQFLYANGPGDSAGAHIDYNCDNVFIQYNLSAYNAGGFCEILGNNYNCAYRYNVSIDDGYRIKGKDGAFQEGKTLWLSGFQGNKAPRKGPINTYIYNNTIYCDSTIFPKIAFDNTSSGILIANNIFHVQRNFQLVLGDQYKPDNGSGQISGNIIFTNNLYLNEKSWPTEILFKDNSAIYGDAGFANPKLVTVLAFVPKNGSLIKNKGIKIPEFPKQKNDLSYKLNLERDILGHKIIGKPSLGAIEPFK